MEDALSVELIQVCSGNEQIATLKTLEVAFTHISRLDNLHYCYNLQELSLIETGQLVTLSGVERVAHSLEILRIIGCELPAIEPFINELHQLRELILIRNSITKIENLEGCPLLTKLWLFGNQITKIENLESNSYIRELWLQENKIETVEALSTLVNLQDLHLSENPIATFNDIREISKLSVIRNLSFGGVDFQACPVTELEGYTEFVLSTISSPYLQILDGKWISQETRDSAKNDYIQEALKLQERLSSIEHEHRTLLMHLDSKNRENEEQLKYIQRMLVDDLHALRTEIENGKSKILKENSRLKALRHKSEETLKQDLQVVKGKYNKELDRTFRDLQEQAQNDSDLYEESIKALEFEEKVAISLIDILYSTEGKIIYNELNASNPEYKFVENICQIKNFKNHYVEIRKIYQIADSVPREASFTYYYIKVSENDLKAILIDKSLTDGLDLRTNLMNCLRDEKGNFLIFVVRTTEGLGDEGEYITIYENDLDKIIFDYLILIQQSTYSVSGNFREITDQRLLAFISDSPDLPIGMFENLKLLEREAIEKYNEHLRRIWGELDPASMDKLKEQDEEINGLLTMADSLREQIENERKVQAQLLQDMRINIKDQTVPPLMVPSENRKNK
ncbi:unnamed protein product [Blepharisma stoltei]|uniref:Uncharacterized protein n=1 Tax=Blepharisma stoltei TaxID=1481888 RepID=A0AAU9K892_9CILI|nr:unnamed protein product [Blepharisma stoltei]